MITNKKGLSPVITTILLVLIALVLASIVLLWARGFVNEGLSKTVGGNDRPIDEACAAVKLDVSKYSANEIAITNTGDIPIYKIGIRVSGAGGDTIDEKDANLNPTSSIIVSASQTITNVKVEIVPILLGASGDGQEQYSCLSNVFSVE